MGLAVLDLSTMAWGSIFDRNKPPYQVHPMISDIIGGGPDGGATILRPESGWSSTHIAQLFTGTMDQTASFIPPDTGDSNGTTGNSDGNGAGRANVGAIVGGTVGGVVFLLLLALGLWWFLRKTKGPGQQQQQEQQRQDNSPGPKLEPNMAEMAASGAILAEVQGDSAHELYGHAQRSPIELESGPGWHSHGGEQPLNVF